MELNEALTGISLGTLEKRDIMDNPTTGAYLIHAKLDNGWAVIKGESMIMVINAKQRSLHIQKGEGLFGLRWKKILKATQHLF